jgi:hypothetical protein
MRGATKRGTPQCRRKGSNESLSDVIRRYTPSLVLGAGGADDTARTLEEALSRSCETTMPITNKTLNIKLRNLTEFVIPVVGYENKQRKCMCS